MVNEKDWTIEYDNDVGPSDESFWEWWNVTNGETTYRAYDEESANYLCKILNQTKNHLGGI